MLNNLTECNSGASTVTHTQQTRHMAFNQYCIILGHHLQCWPSNQPTLAQYFLPYTTLPIEQICLQAMHKSCGIWFKIDNVLTHLRTHVINFPKDNLTLRQHCKRWPNFEPELRKRLVLAVKRQQLFSRYPVLILLARLPLWNGQWHVPVCNLYEANTIFVCFRCIKIRPHITKINICFFYPGRVELLLMSKKFISKNKKQWSSCVFCFDLILLWPD